MGRAIAGVIAGYLAMFVIVFVLLTLAYLAMGAERAFQSGMYEVSGAWLAVMFLVNAIAALAGGFVCGLIAPSSKAPVALAVVIIVLGGLMSIPVFMGPPEGTPIVRDSSVGNMEAMMNAQQPGWVALLNVVTGAAGVMIGARLKRPGPASAPVA